MATKAEILAELRPDEVEPALEFLIALRRGHLIGDDEYLEWCHAIVAFTGFHAASILDETIH